MIYRGDDNSYYEKFLTTGEVKCIDEEIPFEIPKGWEWTRIRNISQSYIGLTYSPTDVSSRGTIVLRSSNIQNGKIVLNDVVRVSKEISEKLQVEKNDIIICARNGSAKLVGKSAVVTDVTEPMTFGAFMAICKTALYQYVSIFLQSDLFFSQLRGVSGTTTINQLTQNNFNDFWIPIPPANEQKRIVEKLQNVSPFIERYSKSQETLNLMNIQIKEQLKKSILQEAIQGKLVPQIAEEGTAQELLEQIRQEKQKLVKEGKLKKSVLTDSVIYKGDDNKYYERINGQIVEVELPFEYPNSWAVLRLKDICQLIDGEKRNGKGICLDAKYLRGKSSATIVEKGKFVYARDNIILVDGENSGEVFTVPQDGYMGSTFKQLWLSSAMWKPYILAFILFYKEELRNSKRGAAIPHLNKELFYNLPIGIPPLAEQQRISERINELSQLLK
ncbi:restriction endonuclease subunit S [Phocaeicola vulgatus]|uniref:Restriction endonuclease subunit S n=1 Tax=Phocaeicola vulgatus TaxID=821 RepID=A0A415DE24_PHOVU|nr:restriction endonuclease subunit S [Phocaeicola vulgatus]